MNIVKGESRSVDSTSGGNPDFINNSPVAELDPKKLENIRKDLSDYIVTLNEKLEIAKKEKNPGRINKIQVKINDSTEKINEIDKMLNTQVDQKVRIPDQDAELVINDPQEIKKDDVATIIPDNEVITESSQNTDIPSQNNRSDDYSDLVRNALERREAKKIKDEEEIAENLVKLKERQVRDKEKDDYEKSALDRAYNEIPAVKKFVDDAKRIDEERKQMIEARDGTINAQNIEIIEKNEKISILEKNYENTELLLDQVTENLDKTIKETTEKKGTKEKFLKMIKNPKFKVAVAAGLMGVAYTAGGGAPAILLLKPLLAKIGVGFIPYTYGASTIGAGAALGAGGAWIGEKLGLIKNDKDAKKAVNEFASGLKEVVDSENNENKEVESTINAELKNKVAPGEKAKINWLDDKGEVVVGSVVGLIKENNADFRIQLADDPELLTKTIKALESKKSGIGALFSESKREINFAYNELTGFQTALEAAKLDEDPQENVKEVVPSEAVIKDANPEKAIERLEGNDSKEKFANQLNIFKREFEKDEHNIDGETVLAIAKLMNNYNSLGGEEKENANKVFDEVFPRDTSLRGEMVDAMAIHADSIGMKGKEVYDNYWPVFEFSQHIGRGDVFRWMLGKIDRLPENIKIKMETEEPKVAVRQEKISDARLRLFEIANVINSNHENMDTDIFSRLGELVTNEINNNRHPEIVGPVVELVKSMAENKEKFDFLKKGSNTGNRDNDTKEAIIGKIKDHMLLMAKNKDVKLGATSTEKESNMKIIASLLDKTEFKEKI